jgi:hypothetical protein
MDNDGETNMNAPRTPRDETLKQPLDAGADTVRRREFVARLARAAVVPAIVAAAAASTQPAFGSV